MKKVKADLFAELDKKNNEAKKQIKEEQ